MISQALRIDEATVTRHINDYLKSEKLTPENDGSQNKLNAADTMALIEHLTKNTYFHIYQIVEYVQSEFQITYSVAGMTNDYITIVFLINNLKVLLISLLLKLSKYSLNITVS